MSEAAHINPVSWFDDRDAGMKDLRPKHVIEAQERHPAGTALEAEPEPEAVQLEAKD